MKTRLALLSSTITALILATSPAAAQELNDSRCLIASSVYAKGAKDPKARVLAEAAKYFYLGRLAATFDQARIRRDMIAERKTFGASDTGKIMSACARQMQAAAVAVQNLTKGLAPPK